jgi:NTP pyrophosphatase (non-canonical NTP hydrolase)
MIRDDILQKLIDFRSARDWENFHTPKNLAISIVLEASELLEHFQWLSETEAKEMTEGNIQEIRNEIADVAIYLSYLAHDLSIDIDAAIEEKVSINFLKYPVASAKGSNKKYNQL